jgi:hypothetical protein
MEFYKKVYSKNSDDFVKKLIENIEYFDTDDIFAIRLSGTWYKKYEDSETIIGFQRTMAYLCSKKLNIPVIIKIKLKKNIII